MGARANVVLYNETKEGIKYSPVIYTHWGGKEMKHVVEEVANYYIQYTGDTNWEVDMRKEVERVFPKLLVACIKNGLEPKVYNFDDMKFRNELPTGNDMPIIADDWGTLLVNIDTWGCNTFEYNWEDEE